MFYSRVCPKDPNLVVQKVSFLIDLAIEEGEIIYPFRPFF